MEDKALFDTWYICDNSTKKIPKDFRAPSVSIHTPKHPENIKMYVDCIKSRVVMACSMMQSGTCIWYLALC